MALPTARLRPLILAVALTRDLPTWRSLRYKLTMLPGEYLEALVLVESSGDPRARRYEPHQDRATRRDARLDPDTPDTDDGLLEDDASYGLMQVMGYNLRALLGVPSVVAAAGENWPVEVPFQFAYDPVTNLSLGSQLLAAELKAVGGDVERALARYNGGPTGDDVRPEYGNDMRLRAYVDRVVGKARLILAETRD